MPKGSTAALKGSFCIFFCMVTIAVHLELVSSLTTKLFLAAFKNSKERIICQDLQCLGDQFCWSKQPGIISTNKKVAMLSGKGRVTWCYTPVFTPYLAKRRLKCIFDKARIVPTFAEFTPCIIPGWQEACLYPSPIISTANEIYNDI